MRSASNEDLVCSKTKSSKELLSGGEEQSVSVVRVRRVLKAEQKHKGVQKECQGVQREYQGVRSIEQKVRRGAVNMGKEELSTKMELDAARFGEQVVGRLEMGEEQDVEVIKIEGRRKARRERRNPNRNLKAESEDQEVDQKTIEAGSATQHSDLKRKPVCSLEVQKVFDVEKERGLKSESLDLDVHQDQDQLRSIKMEIEIEIEAKLDDLRLRDSKSGNNLEEESVQATCSLPAIVDVEDMTSEDYFNDPLGHFAVHEELLKDESRMQGWQAAILDNSHLFRGKVVLEVGCGCGLLSMLAADAEAARVIAIEKSAIAKIAQQIVVDNQLDQVVTVLRAEVEEVELPFGIKEVDVIISEWVGHGLFSKNRLASLIFARNKWLAPNGLVFPDRVRLFIGGAEGALWREERYGFWNQVHGMDMRNLGETSRREPVMEGLLEETVVTTPSLLLELDMHTCELVDLQISSIFHLKVKRVDYLTALFTYFDMLFTHGREPVILSTGPESEATHWRQMIFCLKEDLVVEKEDIVVGEMKVQLESSNTRKVDFLVKLRHHGKWGAVKQEETFSMGKSSSD